MAVSKQFVMAVKRGSESQVPPDWKAQLSQIDGVAVQGSSEKRAQFEASDDAAERVRSKFSDHFHIEEVAERRPL